MKKALLVATVQSHICQFHRPLIELLKENNYEVHVAARDNLKEKNGLKLQYVDQVYDIPFSRQPLNKNNIESYRQLKKIINDNKYDIISCNTPVGGAVTRLAAINTRKKNTKLYYTAHGFHFYKGAPLKNWIIYYPIEKVLSRYTDKLITITQEDYELASKRFKCQIHHIHGVGANSDKYFPYSKKEVEELRKESGYSKDDFLLLCIGELNNNKNQSMIIKAMTYVVKDMPNIKLILAGNGPMEKQLKHLVEEYNLQSNIDFLGYSTSLHHYINISDAIVSASFREGLPLNLMEAMLCAKPVIASNNRGHRELVKHGVNGYILDINEEDFYKCIVKLALSKERENMGNEGVKFIEKFKCENVKNELKAVYGLK